jgi:hypothetical protein
MSIHRKAYNFPDLDVPGDPRLLDSINRRTPKVAGGGINHLPGGTVITAPKKRRSKSVPPCNFATIHRVDGAIKILGGVVTGGSGNITVEETAIGSSASPSDGEQVWLNVQFTAATADEVLLPGGEATAASIHYGNIPDNQIPTAENPDGYLNILLGTWHGGSFSASGCGNFQVSHCPGSLTYFRA